MLTGVTPHPSFHGCSKDHGEKGTPEAAAAAAQNSRCRGGGGGADRGGVAVGVDGDTKSHRRSTLPGVAQARQRTVWTTHRMERQRTVSIVRVHPHRPAITHHRSMGRGPPLTGPRPRPCRSGSTAKATRLGARSRSRGAKGSAKISRPTQTRRRPRETAPSRSQGAPGTPPPPPAGRARSSGAHNMRLQAPSRRGAQCVPTCTVAPQIAAVRRCM